MPTVLDRLIGYVSPTRGLARARARVAMETVRSYEGAKGGRRQSGWNRPSTSANSEIYGDAAKLRDGARDLVRNNSFALMAKEHYVAAMVGTGIVPSPNTGNDRLDKQIASAFAEWCEVADFGGELNFYGVQALTAAALYESGEILTRFEVDETDEETVPLRLKTLESDYLDVYKFASGRILGPELPAGIAYVNQGIAFDKRDRRIGYFLWSQHPGDRTFFPAGLTSNFVPAAEVCHLYRKPLGRPGQIRGVSRYHTVLQGLHDLDDYADAEIMRKKVEACFAAFVTSPEGTDGALLGPSSSDGQSPANRLESLQPGLLEYLKPGESVTFGNPSSGGNYDSFTVSKLHEIATGLGQTYSQMTGDLRQANYSSLRAGMLAFRRLIEIDQELTFIPMFCRPTWRRFIDMAYIAGKIMKPAYGVEWSTPRWESVDPQKDAEAEKTEIRNGTVTWREAVRRRGYDPDRTLEEIAAHNEALDAKKIVLDTDPRLTNAKGSAVPPDDTAAQPAAAQPKG